jgi:hypothetical protein
MSVKVKKYSLVFITIFLFFISLGFKFWILSRAGGSLFPMARFAHYV